MKISSPGVKVVVACAIVMASGVVIWRLVPHFVTLHKYNQRIAPLVKEAELLGISYEHVLEFPYQTVGKPAVWCILNRGKEGVFYDGDRLKRLQVVPSAQAAPSFRLDASTGQPVAVEPPEMPIGYSGCDNMLVIIHGLSSSVFTGAADFSLHKSTMVSVEFVARI